MRLTLLGHFVAATVILVGYLTLIALAAHVLGVAHASEPVPCAAGQHLVIHHDGSGDCYWNTP